MRSTRDIAAMVATTRHIDSGGRGPVPEDAIRAVELEYSAEIAADREARAAALENEKLSTPEARRAPAMQPTNGTHPDDNQRAARPATLRSYLDVNGQEVRLFDKSQKLADYSNNPRGITLREVGGALAGAITGNTGRFGQEMRAMSESYNPGGGVLVNDHVSALLIDAARAKSRIAQLGATTVEMQSDLTRLVRINEDAEIGVVGENETIPFADITLGAVQLVAKSLAVIVPVSRNLLDDSVNAADIIIESLSQSMANTFDNLVINGNGGSDGFMGLLTDPSIGSTTSVGAVHWDDLLTAVNEVRKLEGEPNGFLAHPDVWNALAKLKATTEGLYLNPPAMLDGIVRADTTKLANTSMLCGDFTRVLLGQRGGMVIETSTLAGDSFTKHQQYIKIYMRCACNIARPFFHKLTGLTY